MRELREVMRLYLENGQPVRDIARNSGSPAQRHAT